MIYFDIDGVIRNITALLFGDNTEVINWNTPVSNENIPIVDYIITHPEIYKEAPPYQNYVDFMNDTFDYVVFLSRIPKMDKVFKEYNKEWLNKNIKINFDIKYVDSFGGKLLYLLSRDKLFDDYPYPEAEYDNRIVIVDRPYNKNIKAKIRISEPEESVRYIYDYKIYFKNQKTKEHQDFYCGYVENIKDPIYVIKKQDYSNYYFFGDYISNNLIFTPCIIHFKITNNIKIPDGETLLDNKSSDLYYIKPLGFTKILARKNLTDKEKDNIKKFFKQSFFYNKVLSYLGG